MVSDELNEALARAYQAFAGSVAPRTLDASPVHDAGRILRTLTSAPLRQLSAEQLGDYAASAMTTIGMESDYQHFLPRILELATMEIGWPGLDPPIIAGKLNYGDWEHWAAERRDAVRDVFEAAFRAAIKTHPEEGADAEQWLCGLARLGVPIGNHLDAWRGAAGPEAALQLARFFGMNMRGLQRKAALLNAFWEEAPAAIQRLAAEWPLSPATRTQFELARPATSEEDVWEIDCALLEFDSLQP